eukprot:scaffold14954_cov122-Isochrysis_galbana.AAC.7
MRHPPPPSLHQAPKRNTAGPGEGVATTWGAWAKRGDRRSSAGSARKRRPDWRAGSLKRTPLRPSDLAPLAPPRAPDQLCWTFRDLEAKRSLCGAKRGAACICSIGWRRGIDPWHALCLGAAHVLRREGTLGVDTGLPAPGVGGRTGPMGALILIMPRRGVGGAARCLSSTLYEAQARFRSRITAY